MIHVAFAVEGLDDRGKPSGRFLVVLEAALIVDGKEVGRFRSTEQDRLWRAILEHETCKLVAVETVGEPRTDLTADFICDE